MNKPTIPRQLMPIIAVADVDATRDFYVDVLGFAHAMGVLGRDGHLDFVTLTLGGARIMFARPPEAPPPARDKQPVELYLEVDDVERYHAALTGKQVRITEGLTMQWWGDRTFKVLDPNGYEIWFYQTAGVPSPPSGMKIV